MKIYIYLLFIILSIVGGFYWFNNHERLIVGYINTHGGNMLALQPMLIFGYTLVYAILLAVFIIGIRGMLKEMD